MHSYNLRSTKKNNTDSQKSSNKFNLSIKVTSHNVCNLDIKSPEATKLASDIDLVNTSKQNQFTIKDEKDYEKDYEEGILELLKNCLNKFNQAISHDSQQASHFRYTMIVYMEELHNLDNAKYNYDISSKWCEVPAIVTLHLLKNRII